MGIVVCNTTVAALASDWKKSSLYGNWYHVGMRPRGKEAIKGTEIRADLYSGKSRSSGEIKHKIGKTTLSTVTSTVSRQPDTGLVAHGRACYGGLTGQVRSDHESVAS